jgi:hypothetical protein
LDEDFGTHKLERVLDRLRGNVSGRPEGTSGEPGAGGHGQGTT